MSQFRENLWTDGRMDGRTDGQTLFYRTLPTEAGGPKKSRKNLVTRKKFTHYSLISFLN